MSDSWDQYAADWDSNEDVRAYADKAFASLTEVVNPAGMRVLDFGCGTGQMSERLAPVVQALVALDSSEKMIEVLQAKQLAGLNTLALELTADSIGAEPLLQQPFDLIVASSVCAFLPQYEQTLALLKTLLAPNGVFMQWDWQSEGEEGDFGFTPQRIEAAFEQAGLETVSVSEAFVMRSEQGEMTVLMGVARNG
ncbi:class I SAM-dependent DNA methyltransferase [Marinobacterium jannaschii]|uniref:class I SAM-dependent DNA methyltransferase n=1 Tax=Marinobacterium jannaschii TaxID=64970 RepID=UPI00048782F1|nr:class I SAM-dependent methyltransferase [Marinobacterium jannaschii]